MVGGKGTRALALLLWALTVLGVVEAELHRIEYKAPQLFPESFDWDEKHSRFIVGSTGPHGKLMSVSDAGEVETFVNDEEYADRARIHGVCVDAKRNRVLAVVQSGPRQGLEKKFAALVAYDLGTKNRTLIVRLDEDGGGKVLFNDVAVDGQGNAYVTETWGNSIWQVGLSGEKSLLVAVEQQQPVVWDQPGFADAGLNGIVYHEGLLLVDQSNSGALIRVKLSDKSVQRVAIVKEVTMAGADGMALRSDGSLVVVSAPSAWLLSSRDFWRSATVIEEVKLDASVLTTSAVARDLQTYTLASYLSDQWKGNSRDDFNIQEIEFPADSANSPLWILMILGLFGVLVLVWRFQMNQFNKSYNKKRL